MRSFLLIATLLGLLAAAIAVAVYLWIDFGETEISTIGVISMIAGVVVATLLGAGLMALVFISNRRGWDDHQGVDAHPADDRGQAADGGDGEKKL